MDVVEGKKVKRSRTDVWTPERREAMRKIALEAIEKAKADGIYKDVAVDKSKWFWNAESRERFAQKVKQISKSRKNGWTEEKRAQARLKLARDKEEYERILRRKKTRYLKKVDTGEIFVWTERLAERKDMVEVNELPKNTETGRAEY